MGLAPHFFRHLDQPIMGPHTRGGNRTFLIVADGVFCYWYEKKYSRANGLHLMEDRPHLRGEAITPGRIRYRRK